MPRKKREGSNKTIVLWYKRYNEKFASIIRLLIRTLNRIATSFNPAILLQSLGYIVFFSIFVNICDNTIRSIMELTSNESGLLYLFKLLVPLITLAANIACLVFVIYTPVLNLLTMFIGMLNKSVDVMISISQGLTKEQNENLHGFAIALAIFTGAALMLTIAPVIGECLFLIATYYSVLDVFGWNPLRSTEASDNQKKRTQPFSANTVDWVDPHELKQRRAAPDEPLQIIVPRHPNKRYKQEAITFFNARKKTELSSPSPDAAYPPAHRRFE